MEFSADQIAQMVAGTVEGDGSVMISEFAKIEEGGQGSLTFLSKPQIHPVSLHYRRKRRARGKPLV